MRSLRLTNFRSFVDTSRIELRPITVLAGANSSGKSSYLRFFPLLRQTAETTTRSPLLWFGPFVDFGDFSKAVSRGKEPATLGFSVDINVPLARRRMMRRFEEDELQLTISVALRAHIAQTYVSSLTIVCGQDTCVIEIDEKDQVTTFRVNSFDALAASKPAVVQAVPAPFVPSISWWADGEELDRAQRPLYKSLADYLGSLAHNRTKSDTLQNYAAHLTYGPVRSLLSQVRALKLRHLAHPVEGDPAFRQIAAMTLAKDVDYLLTMVQRSMSSFASGINYLGPFRKDPERFYRQQELSVGQIEPHGENLAMFLKSLSKDQLNDLSEFVYAYLGFRVAVERDGSHVTVMVGEKEAQRFNLIDMGYGISQVLPVLAQCWSTSRGVEMIRRERATTMLAIEQPELHLHPSHQAKLADMFAAVLNRVRGDESKVPKHDDFDIFLGSQPRARFPFRMLIETHSETMITRFGELVESGILKAEDLVVLLFSKDDVSGATEIREASYGLDGTLENWPLGFFAP